MSNYESAWKKQKPKTLLKDPLSGPLKELDAAIDAAASKTANLSDLAAASGKAKLAKIAVGATIKAMNPTLHKESIAWLKTEEKKIDTAITYHGEKQKRYMKAISELRKKRDDLVTDLKIVVARPGVQVATKAMADAKAFGAWYNSNAAAHFSSTETTSAVQGIAGAQLTLKDLIATIQEGNANKDDAAALKKAQVNIKGQVGDLTGIIKKLSTLGGMEDKRG